MKKNRESIVFTFVATFVFTASTLFAQNSLVVNTQDQDLGFFGDVSIKIYCTFSNFVPGSDNKACGTDIFVNDRSEEREQELILSSQEQNNSTSTLTNAKRTQVNTVINNGLALGLNNSRANIVYMRGPVGPAGPAGTTTIVYQTTIAGAASVSPAAYIFAGGNTNSNPYQTTVPGDIFSTFVHHLTVEDISGTLANLLTINASTTNTANLNFTQATGTNLFVSGTTYSNNLIGTSSTVTNATSTNLFSLFSNLVNLYFSSATGTNLQVANASTTNFSATGTSFISDLYLASSTQINSSINSGNATLTTIVAGNSTSTNLFATNASISEATTTYFFAAFANFLNLFVNDLRFDNATGTNLFVDSIVNKDIRTNNLEIASTSGTVGPTFSYDGSILNLDGPGGVVLSINGGDILSSRAIGDFSSYLVASSTRLNSLDATITNATTTKFFATNASITNGTSTTWFSLFERITNLLATNATLTNATITNLRVQNCAEGNVLCNGGNDTGAVAGPDPVLTIGTLNAGNIVFITGDTGFPSVAPGSPKLIIETGVAGDGSGDVRVMQTLKIGENIVASGTFAFATGTISSAIITNSTSTNISARRISTLDFNATGTAYINTLYATTTFATTSSSTNMLALNLFGSRGTITNATSTNFFVTRIVGTNASITNATFTSATTTNLFVNFARILDLTISALAASIINTGTLNASTTNASTTNFLNASGTNLTILNIGTTPGNATITVAASLVPSASSTYDLGSALFPWRDLWVSSTTVHIGGNALSASGTNILWNGAPLSISSSTASTSFADLQAGTASITQATFSSTTVGEAIIASSSVFNLTIQGGQGYLERLFAYNLDSENATSTNLFAKFFSSVFANFNQINTGDLMATGTILANNISASGDSIFSGMTVTNATITNATLTNATFTKIYAEVVETDVVDYRGITGLNATISNATITNALASHFSSDAITTNSILINGEMTVKGNIQLATSDSSVNDFGTGDYTHNNYGNGVEVVNVLGSDTGENYLFGSTTVTNIYSNFGFFYVLNAIDAWIDNLTAKNISVENLNASTTNSDVLNATTFTFATGTIASTSVESINIKNSFTKKSSVEDLSVNTINYDSAIGKATTSNFSNNTTIGNIDGFTVFNMSGNIPNLVFTLASPTNIIAGKIIYINNIGTNTFTILGSNILADSGRTFVWTGSKWAVNADGTGSASTGPTILTQTKSTNKTSTNNTLSTDSELSFNVVGKETWYYAITGTLVGGDSSNNGMAVQVTVPTGSTNCSTSLYNFNLKNSWATSTCGAAVNGTSNWSSPNNFKIDGVFTTGNTSGSARFNWAKNTNNGTDITLAASSTVLTAFKISGADLAEVYYTTGDVIPYGEIVSLDGTGVSQVVRSNTAYDTKALGIVSTKPGTIIGEADGTGTPVVVGLSGRVPVKVTTKNGNINPGDFITSSDIPGVGMKATSAGRVLGKALTGFEGTGDEQGMVQVFIQNTYYEGDEDEGISERITLATGKIADKFTNSVKTSFENLSDTMLNMTLWVKTLKSENVQTQLVQTDRLCVGQTCITESELKDFLEYKKTKESQVVPLPVEPEEIAPQTETEVVETEIVPEIQTPEVGEPVIEPVPVQ